MYQIGSDGLLVRPSLDVAVLEHYFTGGAALPSWLTVPEGTPTITPVGTSSQGSLQVLTGSTVGNAAQLRALDVDPSRFVAIDFRLIGLTAGASGVTDLLCDMYFQMRTTTGTPAGIDYKQTISDANVVSQIAGVTTPVANAPSPARATWRTQGEAKNRRTIGILWYTQDKQAVLYEGRPETERCTRVHSSMSVGSSSVVVPRFRMVTQEAAARAFSVQGVRLALYS